MSTEVPSPCIAICQLDDNDEFCIGCFRTTTEIRLWSRMSNEEKLAILDQLPEREKKYEDLG